VATHTSNTIIKIADDTTVVGLITNNDETAYREEVRALGVWCQENKLSVNKTKEMIVDFKKQQREHPPIHIEGAAVEKLERFMFLGVHITDKLKCSTHTDSVVQKEPEEMWLVTENPDKLLQMHNREHPVGLYHNLVRQLHRPQPQGYCYVCVCLSVCMLNRRLVPLTHTHTLPVA
jgi:hypothetical protein